MANTQNRNSIEQIISSKAMLKLKQKNNKRAALAIVVVSVALLFTAVFSFNYIAENELDKAATKASYNLDTVKSLHNNQLNFLKNVVFQLNSESELQRFIMDKNELSKQFIVDNWLTITEQLNWIHQIRYIDNNGYELLKVKFDAELGIAEHIGVVQNIRSEDFFQQAQNLKQHEMYISAINLNREYNELSYPLTPVLRIAMPVYLSPEHLSGYIVVNFFADKLLSMINDVTFNFPGVSLVVDEQGNYLQGYESEQNWSFDLAGAQTVKFRDQYADVWRAMQSAEGEFSRTDDRFIYRQLDFVDNLGEVKRYFVIQHINRNDVDAEYGAQISNLYLVFALLLILAIFEIIVIFKGKLRKQVEHNSLELISALFFSKEPILITDSKWNIDAVNKAFSKSTGYLLDDVAGMPCDHLYLFDDADLLAEMTKTVDQDGFWLGELQNKRKDGGETTNLIFVSSVKSIKGRVLHYVVQMLDITKRKMMENELKIAAAAFDTRSAITITDRNGNIIRANKAFTDITGYDLADVLGQNPSILSSGKHDQQFYQHLWQAIIDTGFWQGEIYNRHKNGSIYPEWITISSIKNDAGEIIYYVATFEDITERKRLEAEIEKLSQDDGKLY
ncbi:hypothetical protein A9Q98_08520 [Thalassotalea sp. 42_200_T64]|nr:hypothetical protein A9Q98_08520 [Thalassotalea sp. 42_200_T64]